VAELRINEQSGGPAGRRRVEVAWQDGAERRVAVSEFDDLPDDRDGERIRWYLEDYAEFPADPAPTIARDAETRLAQVGVDLFSRVFSSVDAAEIWERARDRLAEVRVEVEADPRAGPGLAWELLRDPRREAAVALDAGAFVRTHRQAAGGSELPEPSGDRLRVLLVICRPGGRDDVPFRSVASRLIRGGAAEQMEGLHLDVLRPATFARLSQVLHTAYNVGRPYHVVHFDGHGTYLDLTDLGLKPDADGQRGGGVGLPPLMHQVSIAGPVRPGQHGYLLFEDPDSEENQQLVDGPTLGRLLTSTCVHVLVLNACRSAFAKTRGEPGGAPSPAPAGTGASLAVGGGLAGDVHARIAAYGSLAAEVADAGVNGVVAMRYNVYVVTAAQFVADLYAHLLAGRSLGQAATAARRALAADPVRQIGAAAVALQDWAVPVVYESASLALLRPQARAAPLIRLTPSGSKTTGESEAGPDDLPGPPDAGFFGRDETLLALDRAFDSQLIVLLHAFAGAGKSSTAAEFVRWYSATGGLDHPEHPEWAPGAVLWSSFERHLTADQVIGTAGDHFAALLEANGIAWQALTDPAQRRDIVMQVLAQLTVLWVWDNIEPVTGFPADTASAWTSAEQDDLVSLLRDLAQRTRCRVLLTSRRNEHAWLGGLPTRVRLPAMPMRESLQLASALAARHGHSLAEADWRSLLGYAAGNPLTITVLIGQALRENLTSTADIDGFVDRLRAGEVQLEAGEDAALGRTRSLAASLNYGFAHAFTGVERAQLATLHLFRRTTDVHSLRFMGDPVLTEDAVPELADLDTDECIALLDRTADIGLLTSLGDGFYQIHPALPWYFNTLFTATYGIAGHPAADRAARAYAEAIGELGNYCVHQSNLGRGAQILAVLRAEEANLLHALDLARAVGLWAAAVGCLQGLHVLYERTGRDGEWARLIAAITPDFADPATGGPRPGREQHWSTITGYRMQLAKAARDWAAAVALLDAISAWDRNEAAEGLAASPGSLTPVEGNQPSEFFRLRNLGDILLLQEDPSCLSHYQEALALAQRIGDRAAEAQDAGSLGNAYLMVPALRDLDQAERWLRHSLSLRPDRDRYGRSKCLTVLGGIALERFNEAHAAGQAEPMLLKHINTALRSYQEALKLTPADDHEALGIRENQLGNVFSSAGETGQALRHYQRAVQHKEAHGDVYGAGTTRYNIAVLLARDGRINDALQYVYAALGNLRQAGQGAAPQVAVAERLITILELRLP
jgi:tetratricopeptide (TPR) repeat protein